MIKSHVLYRLSYGLACLCVKGRLQPGQVPAAGPRCADTKATSRHSKRSKHRALRLPMAFRDSPQILASSAARIPTRTSMPTVNRIADFHAELTEWRRDLHAHPELRYDVHRTAGFVAERLRAFGCDEVVTGIGRTGVVGVIRGQWPARRCGRAADPRDERSALQVHDAGKHACVRPRRTYRDAARRGEVSDGDA